MTNTNTQTNTQAQAQTTSEMLAASHILVEVSTHQWSANKKDNEIAKKAAADNNAVEKAIAASRRLMVGADAEYEAVKKSIRALTGYVMENTAPWSSATVGPRKGPRLLSVARSADFMVEVKRLTTEFEQAKAAFTASYSTRQQQAMANLGKAAHADDYPAPSEIGDLFGVEVRYLPVPINAAPPSHLPIELVEAINDQTKQANEARLANAMGDLFERTEVYLTRMATNLQRHADGEKVNLRTSLVENLRQMKGMLEASDFDPRLTKLAQALEPLIELDTPQLKSSPARSAEVAKTAAKTAKAVDALLDDIFA